MKTIEIRSNTLSVRYRIHSDIKISRQFAPRVIAAMRVLCEAGLCVALLPSEQGHPDLTYHIIDGVVEPLPSFTTIQEE